MGSKTGSKIQNTNTIFGHICPPVPVGKHVIDIAWNNKSGQWRYKLYLTKLKDPPNHLQFFLQEDYGGKFSFYQNP